MHLLAISAISVKPSSQAWTRTEHTGCAAKTQSNCNSAIAAHKGRDGKRESPSASVAYISFFVSQSWE